MTATDPGDQYLKWRGENPKPEPGVVNGPPLPAFPAKPFEVELVFVDDKSYGYLKIVKEDNNTVDGFLKKLVIGKSLQLMGVPHKEVKCGEHFLYYDGKTYRRVKVDGLHEDGYTIIVLDVDTFDDLKCSARELYLLTREVISYPVEVFRCELNDLEIFKGTAVITDVVPNITPQTYNCSVKINKEIPLVRLSLRDGSERSFADLIRNEVTERCTINYPPVGESARVIVTFADKWGNIWFQYPSVLMDNIRKYFETLDPSRMAPLDNVTEYMSNPSRIFLGKWEGILCRLRILKLRSFGKVKVEYIDYGNKGLLMYDEIYPLHSSEANIGVVPPQCLKVHLIGISHLMEIDRFWEHINEDVWIKIIAPEPADSVEGILCTPSSNDKGGKAKPTLENFNKKLLAWKIGSSTAGEDVQSPEDETFQCRLPTVQEQTEEESPVQTNNMNSEPKTEIGTNSGDPLPVVNETSTEKQNGEIYIPETSGTSSTNIGEDLLSPDEETFQYKLPTVQEQTEEESLGHTNHLNSKPEAEIRTVSEPIPVVNETTTEEHNAGPYIPETSARSSTNMQVVVHNNNSTKNSLDIFHPRVVPKVIQTSGASWKFGGNGQFTYCTGLDGSRLPVLDGGVGWTGFPKSDTTCRILVTQQYPETDELTLQVYNSAHPLQKLEIAMNEYYAGIPITEDPMPVEWLSLGGLYAIYSTDLRRWVRARALAISHSGRGTDPWNVTVRLLDYGYFVTALLPDLQLLRPLLPIFCYLKFQGFTATLYVDNWLKCGPILMENPIDIGYKVHVVKRQDSPERDVPNLKIVFISSFPLLKQK